MASFTPDQIQKLQDLGISAAQKSPGWIPTKVGINNSAPSILPLLSISGLSLISIGSLLFFKSKSEVSSSLTPNTKYQTPDTQVKPTQVPKSIQHYLLASQQYFSQALQLQNNQDGPPLVDNVLALLNQSLTLATQAITDYPSDYRGYDQRARIYQSLSDSQPTLIDKALSDFSTAAQLNPDSAEITRQLAILFAKKGDVNNTLSYLGKTVVLEPTKAQNFYDLAQLQQQAGLLPDAINTYSQLLTIVPDTTQKQQVQNQLTSLQELLKQNESGRMPTSVGIDDLTTPTPALTDPKDNLLQADSNQGLIIAAPSTSKNITITGQSSSNALSGSATLSANQASFTLTNSNITQNSLVYVTATKGGVNQSLQVLSKSEGSCTIGFSSPISEDVEFNWWIIN